MQLSPKYGQAKSPRAQARARNGYMYPVIRAGLDDTYEYIYIDIYLLYVYIYIHIYPYGPDYRLS